MKNIVCWVTLGLISVFLYIAFLSGIITWGVIISKMDDYKQKPCTETTCFVQVIDHLCLAKFELYPNDSFTFVDCDKPRHGLYNITLPCDIDKKEDRPILKCMEKTTKRKYKLAIIIISLVVGVLLPYITLALIAIFMVWFS